MGELLVISPQELIDRINSSIYTHRLDARRVYERIPNGYHFTDRIKIKDMEYVVPHATVGAFYIYYDSNGVLSRDLAFLNKDVRNSSITVNLDKKKNEFCKAYLGMMDPIWYTKYNTDRFFQNILTKNLGSKTSELKIKIDSSYNSYISGRGYIDKEERQRWLALSDEAKTFIVGLDRKAIDIYPTGFSVRLLMKTGKSFQDQKQFVKNNGKDILRFVMGEIENSKRILNKIGDLKFYKPVEITVLRSNECDIKFEVKGDFTNART